MEVSIRGISWLKKIDMQKGGVRFSSVEMSELNKQHAKLKADYEKAQKCVVRELLTVAAGYSEPLYALGNCTAQLDVVVGLATAAVSAPGVYTRPRFSEHAGGIRLRDFRHPCLECQDGVSVIPNDVDLQRGQCTAYYLAFSRNVFLETNKIPLFCFRRTNFQDDHRAKHGWQIDLHSWS